MITVTHTSIRPKWIRTLLKALRGDGYRVAFFDADTPLDDKLVQNAQVIITSDPVHVRRLRRVFGGGKLYALVTDDYETISSKAADFIFPPSLNYIRRQLRAILRFRDEHMSLQAETERLQKTLSESHVEVELLKSAIIRNVSHELRTPVLQVKSAVSLMSEDSDNPELIDYAKISMARLESLVKHITLLGNTFEANLGPVIVRDVIDYVKRNINRAWRYDDALSRIVTHYEDGTPPVMADKQGLSTVIELLIDNALKFSHDEVSLSVTPQGDHILIAVSDRGIGIAPADVESIFDMFFQVDASSTRKYEGAGIGLTIARLILQQHNSTIQVCSEPGGGSVFSFTLKAINI